MGDWFVFCLWNPLWGLEWRRLAHSPVQVPFSVNHLSSHRSCATPEAIFNLKRLCELVSRKRVKQVGEFQLCRGQTCYLWSILWKRQESGHALSSRHVSPASVSCQTRARLFLRPGYSGECVCCLCPCSWGFSVSFNFISLSLSALLLPLPSCIYLPFSCFHSLPSEDQPPNLGTCFCLRPCLPSPLWPSVPLSSISPETG